MNGHPLLDGLHHTHEQDAGILYFKDGRGLRVRKLTAGEGITITDGGEPRDSLTVAVSQEVATAYKASDKTLNNQDTLEDDADLNLSLAASEVWSFNLFLPITTNSTADFKFAFTVPSGASGYYRWIHQTGATTAGGEENSITDTNTVAGSANDVLSIEGVVINSTDAGTFQLQWAQGTATMVNTTVRAGTWLVAHKLS